MTSRGCDALQHVNPLSKSVRSIITSITASIMASITARSAVERTQVIHGALRGEESFNMANFGRFAVRGSEGDSRKKRRKEKHFLELPCRMSLLC